MRRQTSKQTKKRERERERSLFSPIDLHAKKFQQVAMFDGIITTPSAFKLDLYDGGDK